MIENDGRLALVDLRFIHREKAAGASVDDVVRKNIVRHIPLHLEFTRLCARRIVVVERVVDHCAVLSVSPLRVITADGNTGGMVVIDKVIPCSDVTGSAVLVLTCQFDSKVHIMHDILFDQDPGAAVYVNTIRIFIVAICRIAARCDVVNQIPAHDTVARLVYGRVGSGALETDDVDSNVVVIVDNIVRNAEVRNVPFTTSDSLEPVLR